MSVTEERIQELDRSFLEFMSKAENVEAATKEIYEDLLDEVFMGFVFDVHRTIKTGSSDVEEGIPDDESYAIVGESPRPQSQRDSYLSLIGTQLMFQIRRAWTSLASIQ